MAEFVEVMKWRERMCDELNNCSECGFAKSEAFNKIYPGVAPKFCMEYTINNPQEAEEIIMAWEKEHPVKTNADKFKEVFGVETSLSGCNGIFCQKGLPDCKNCDCNGFWSKEYIEPKEVQDEQID